MDSRVKILVENSFMMMMMTVTRMIDERKRQTPRKVNHWH